MKLLNFFTAIVLFLIVNLKSYDSLIIEFDQLQHLMIYLDQFTQKLPQNVKIKRMNFLGNDKISVLLTKSLKVGQIFDTATSIKDFDVYETEVKGRWFAMSIRYNNSNYVGSEQTLEAA